MSDNPNLENTGATPKSSEIPAKQFITDTQIFESIKPKITSKYGEEVASILQGEYSKGIAYDKMIEEKLLDEIPDKAREYKENLEGVKKLNKVYESFQMDVPSAEKAIKEIFDNDAKFRNMITNDKSLLKNPAVISNVLETFKERQKAESEKMFSYGVNPSGEGKTADVRKSELYKLSLSKKLTTQESTELTNLIKLTKKS